MTIWNLERRIGPAPCCTRISYSHNVGFLVPVCGPRTRGNRASWRWNCWKLFYMLYSKCIWPWNQSCVRWSLDELIVNLLWVGFHWTPSPPLTTRCATWVLSPISILFPSQTNSKHGWHLTHHWIKLHMSKFYLVASGWGRATSMA